MTRMAFASYNHSGPLPSTPPENSVQIRKFCSRKLHIHRCAALAFIGFLSLLACSFSARAQGERAPVAPPGDTLTTPGPLAQNLSSNIDRRDLAKAIKLVADWQLGRLPADA